MRGGAGRGAPAGAATMSGDEEFYLFENVSSVGPWDGPQYHIAPPWAFYLQTAFMGFVFFVGTPLNAVVLVVTVKYKKLRQPLNYILVNISLGGFIFCVLCVFMVFISSSQGYFIFGRHLCALEGFMGSTAGLVTGWSLAFLAFERYIVICKPFGNFRFSSKHALVVVAATWVIGVGVSIPPFFGWSRVPSGVMLWGPGMPRDTWGHPGTGMLWGPGMPRETWGCPGSRMLWGPRTPRDTRGCQGAGCPGDKGHGTPGERDAPGAGAGLSRAAAPQFRACILETVCGKPMTDESDVSSSAQKTEVSSVSSSQVSPS
uniref:Opsin 1, short wave sensitive n=4 Tax=Casuariiformes TaxID=8784 RepID=A0A8C4KKP9_DRONO